MDQIPETGLRHLLSLDHPDGHGKAVFFARFGFTAAEWEELARAFVRHAYENDLVERAEALYGVQYVVEGPLKAPDGRTPLVRSVWEQRPGERGPRLVTAYPGSRKK